MQGITNFLFIFILLYFQCLSIYLTAKYRHIKNPRANANDYLWWIGAEILLVFVYLTMVALVGADESRDKQTLMLWEYAKLQFCEFHSPYTINQGFISAKLSHNRSDCFFWCWLDWKLGILFLAWNCLVFSLDIVSVLFVCYIWRRVFHGWGFCFTDQNLNTVMVLPRFFCPVCESWGENSL